MRAARLLLASTLVALSSVAAQDSAAAPTTGGIVNASACQGRGCKCLGPHYGRALGRYEHSVFCIFLEPLDKKAVFYPKVDEFAVLELPDIDLRKSGSGNSSVNAIWVAAEGQGSVGQNRALDWVDHTKSLVRGSFVIPFLTAIVHVQGGVVQRVQWDSGCHTCSFNTDDCLPDSTAVVCGSASSPSECRDCGTRASGEICSSSSSACVPRVYVGWLGTDANNVPCNSAGKVISRFRSYSASGLYASASGSTVSLTDVQTGQPAR